MASVGKFTSGRKPDGAGNLGILLAALGGTVLFLVGGFALLGALSPGGQTEAQFFRNDFDKTPQTTAEKTVPRKKTAAPKQQSAAARPELKEVPKEQVAAPQQNNVQEQPVQQPAPLKTDPVTTGAIPDQPPEAVVQTPAPKKAATVRKQRPRARPNPKREQPKHTTNPFLQLFGG